MSSTKPTVASPAARPTPTDELDAGGLSAWLAEHVDGFSGPLDVRRFAGGQSNPTYQLVTPRASYVLRRKPSGQLLKSAHAVDREFRVLRALHGAGFPVPRAHALCSDRGVIGAEFYVMEMVEGRILWNAGLPDHTPQERAAIYDEQICVLARLHNLDPGALGLADFGAAGNYFGRQVARWTKQYRASESAKIEEMDRLIAWLPASLPPNSAPRIVHGDFRIDNMVFDAAKPRVIAVLDWELSTLGDPIADLTYFLMQWAMPRGERSSLIDLDLGALGIPTMERMLDRYTELTNTAPGASLDWCLAFNLFRLAAILQGVAHRHVAGNASNASAGAAGARVRPLAQTAWRFAEKAGAA